MSTSKYPYEPVEANVANTSVLATALLPVHINPTAVTIISASDTVAQNRWSAAVAFALGGTYSGVIESISLVAGKNTGSLLTDMFGRLAFFASDPSLAANTTTLTSAQALLMLGPEIKWLNSELVTDTNSVRLGALTQIPFPALSQIYVAFFSQGATSFAAAQILSVRLGIHRRV